ncbi:hypothetical protein PoB_007402000 [Plakobranchus ocellatus]|uniref:Uncharacterized protein n=1 Tax=Plakobranchus ocellatus TaxID=259542 RepID=A0AAV4DTN7_9GAST|nr:hypothetical protein PoB_007402000 [Plakobranchus ocellatus]
MHSLTQGFRPFSYGLERLKAMSVLDRAPQGEDMRIRKRTTSAAAIDILEQHLQEFVCRYRTAGLLVHDDNQPTRDHHAAPLCPGAVHKRAIDLACSSPPFVQSL